MKTTFTSHEIAHVWVHADPDAHGKAPANVRFDGDKFYSYGTVIARKVRNKKGEQAFIVNSAGFSVSTTRHQGRVRYAIPNDAVRFDYADGSRGTYLNPSPEAMYQQFVDRAVQYLQKADAAKKPEKAAGYRAEMSRALDDAAAVAKFFGLRKKTSPAKVEKLRQQVAKQAVADAKALKEREAYYAELEAERERSRAIELEKWVAGEQTGCAFYQLPVRFRIEGDELVSSLGARVPIEDARRAMLFCLRKRTTGWRRNGEQFAIGAYLLDSVNEAGIVAGCHRVSWEEIERVKGLLDAHPVKLTHDPEAVIA